MKTYKRYNSWLIMGLLLATLLVGLAWSAAPNVQAQEGEVGAAALNVPSNSSPIAFGGGAVWVVNPDDDSVSLIDAATDTLARRIVVGDEPRSIALAINNDAYVANAADNSVTIINFGGSINNAAAVKTLSTGAEPWDIVARPDGAFVYVANSAQDTISVINTTTRQVVSTFNLATSACNVGDTNRHFQPRGLAITGNGQFLFVTRFLSFTNGGGKQAVDTGKEGLVCRLTITAGTGALGTATSISLPAQDTGFTANINNTPTATSAYPNQLQSIVICGSGIANEKAYLPNVAASPTGPLRFNVDTQAFVNTVGNLGATPTSLGALNLHLGARDPEPGQEKLFFANPWAMTCNNPTNPSTAYVVSAGSDLLVKLNVGGGGALSFTVDDDTTRYINLNNDANNALTTGAGAGKNPLGIVVNELNTKLYVMNYLSRNVSVIDLASDSVIKTIQTTTLPPTGSQAEQLHVGAEMFFSSRGLFDEGKVNRLSSEGWQNCASCHPGGLTDGVIWRFGAGPRKSVPLNGTWSPLNPDDQRVLNYSAIFDELEDFELNIRNVSGPGPLNAGPPPVLDPDHGLLIGDDGNANNAPGIVNAFALPNAGRPQLNVTLPGSNTAWPALEALREWVRFAIRTPNGALTDDEGVTVANGGLDQNDVNLGRRRFFQAGCQKCHGGSKWTISNKDFTSPPAGGDIFTEAGAAGVAGAQFLDRFLSDINSFNLNVDGTNAIPGQPQIGGTEKANTANVADTDAAALTAIGIDHNNDGAGDGYNIPSLLGIWGLQPYYHNGACETLTCVLNNVTHRTAGLRQSQSDPFTNATNRDAVIAFLKTLDADTEVPTNLYIDRHDIFVDPPTVFKGSTGVTVGVNLSLFGTKADLENLAADTGVSDITVRFTFSPSSAVSPSTVDVSVPVTAFNQDFGQAIVSDTFDFSSDAPRRVRVTVEVDPDNQFSESDEDDNEATRRIRVLNPPPDQTPPQVTSIIISPNTTFSPQPQITQSRDVKVQIVATDNDAVESFCIVRYAYDVPRRRWVEENCTFQPLPAQTSADTFVVDARLRPKEGVGYVFVWVKDASGNISRQPGFDFITFISGNPINLNRNDRRLIRINTGSAQTLTFTPEFGDVDVSVFQGIGANATRCAVSANNGTTAEVVTVPGGGCAGTEFQIEVLAIVNSRFTVGVAPGFLVAENSSNVAASAALSDKPLVGGPPALQTAIGDEDEIFLPVILK